MAAGWGGDAVSFATRGEGLAVAGADDAARECGEVVAERGGRSEGADVEAGDLEGVEEAAGLDGIDLAGGDGCEEQGDGELDGLGVFERREVEGGRGCELGRILAVLQQILNGFGAQGTDFGSAGGLVAAAEDPVIEAEVGAGDGGRLAAPATGPDVTADGVLVGLGVHEFLVQALNAKGHKTRPRVVDGLRPFFFYLYFYYMGLGETTMPTIFLVEVDYFVSVRGIIWC